MMTTTTKMQGAVKRIKREEGFGWIAGDDGTDRFFHRSALEKTGLTGELGFDGLEVDMRVEFIHLDATKGPRAIDVRVVRV